MQDPKTMAPMFLDQAGFEQERDKFVRMGARYVVDRTVRRRLQVSGSTVLQVELVNHLFFNEGHTHTLRRTEERVTAKRIAETVRGDGESGRLLVLDDGRFVDACDAETRVPMQPLHLLCMCLTDMGYPESWPDVVYTQIVRRTRLDSLVVSRCDPPVEEDQPKPEEPPICCVCLDGPVTCVLRPCGHAGFCMPCAAMRRPRRGRARLQGWTWHTPCSNWSPLLVPGAEASGGRRVVRREGTRVHFADGSSEDTGYFVVEF